MKNLAHHLARVGVIVHNQYARARQAHREMLADRGRPRRRHRDRSPRQRHRERRTTARTRTRRRDGAAVQLHQVVDNREAEAEPAVRARRAGLSLAEAVEDVRKKLRADPRAGVADDDLRRVVVLADCNVHPAALRREPYRVGKKVPHDLLQALRIGLHIGHHPFDVIRHLHALAFSRRRNRLDGGLDDVDRRDAARVERDLTVDAAGDVEQIVNQARLHPRVPLDHA